MQSNETFLHTFFFTFAVVCTIFLTAIYSFVRIHIFVYRSYHCTELFPLKDPGLIAGIRLSLKVERKQKANRSQINHRYDRLL